MLLRFCLVLTLATLAAAGPGYKAMMMKKMAKHYFDQMCWGKDNQMAKYKSIKESLASCMGQAAPAPRAMPQKMVRAIFHPELVSNCSIYLLGDETSPFLPCPHLFHCVAIPVHQVPQKSITLPPTALFFCRYHHLGKRATPEEETAEFLNDWVDFQVWLLFVSVDSNSLNLVFDLIDFQGDLEHKIGNLTCVFDKMGLHTASGDVSSGIIKRRSIVQNISQLGPIVQCSMSPSR